MNLNRESKTHATKASERIMMDISLVKINEKKSTKRFWLLVVDEATDMKWSYFIRSKKQQVPIMMGFIEKLQEMGNPFVSSDAITLAKTKS